MTNDLDTVLEELRAFVRERQWDQFHDVKNLTMLLTSEAGELAAELRWVRSEELADCLRDPEVLGRLKRELGDVGIAVLLLCDRLGVTLPVVVRDKLRENSENYPAELARAVPRRPLK